MEEIAQRHPEINSKDIPVRSPGSHSLSSTPNVAKINDDILSAGRKNEALISTMPEERDKEKAIGAVSGSSVSTSRLVVILGLIWSMVFFNILDETMIATLLGPISITFKSFTNLSWTATIYILGLSASQLLANHFTDLFGRLEGLVISCAIFAIGCLVCGLSTSLPVLLVGRTIQGFGGGAMALIAAIIESDLVPLRTRGITEAIGGIFTGVGLGLGGLWGGGINDAIGWKWAFLIQVPIIVGGTIMIWLLVKIPRKKWDFSTLKRIDYVGSFALLAAIIFLQVGLDSGGNTVSWTDPLVLTSLPLALASFVVFVGWNLRYATEPVIPLRLFAIRNVALGSFVCFTQLCSYYSNLFYVPIYLQVIGYSTMQTGLRFIIQAFGAAFGTFTAGLIVKRTGRYYYLNIIGQAIFVLGSGLFILLEADTPAWCIFVFLLLTGLGFGIAWITLLMGMLTSISSTEQGIAQSISWSMRTLGMVVGLTISSATFQTVLKANLESKLGDMDGSSHLIYTIRTNFAELQNLNSTVKDLGVESYVGGLHAVFYITTAEIALSALASFFMTENEIPDTLK